MMKLENKVAIITGSTRGIGRATAKLFAAEGAKVVVVGTNAELGDSCVAEIKADGGEAIFCKTDVTSEESLAALVKAALDTYGRIDILVNNAGVGGSTANMNDITMDEWNKVLATNLTAPFMLCKKVIPVMEEQGGGAIVNIASMASTVVMFSSGENQKVYVLSSLCCQMTDLMSTASPPSYMSWSTRVSGSGPGPGSGPGVGSGAGLSHAQRPLAATAMTARNLIPEWQNLFINIGY